MLVYRYILNNLILPFFGSIFVLTSVLLLQFLMKFADNLVGKGLSIIVIVKLIAYNLAWMFVLVVPMAILVATIMAFGTLGQNNEIAILKASGMSLYKMMIPPVALAILLAVLLVQFNNRIYPDANHAARMLMTDISKQKPTLSLIPGVFSQEVDNFSILVREIDPKTNELKELTIYDYSDRKKTNIITAKSGRIYFAKQFDKLIMDLKDGQIHESDVSNQNVYRVLDFNKHKIAMNADKFTFKQSGPGEPRGNREMGAEQLKNLADSLKNVLASINISLESKIQKIFLPDSANFQSSKIIRKPDRYSYLRAEDVIKSARNTIRASLNDVEYRTGKINSYWVEIHKKYSIPFACIVFVLVGAPLGAIARKGGMGVAAPLSFIFIFIYWIFLIGGEKLADRGFLSPFWGMWSGNFVLTGLGIFMTVKSAKERITFDFSFLKKLVPSGLKRKSDEN